MRANELAAVEGRLAAFLEGLTGFMGRRDRRAWAGAHVRGLLLDGQRKSAEPMAARLGRSKQGLQQFVSRSPWPAALLMEGLVKRKTRREAPACWIIDETSFPKAGKHPVGVARQYGGALGKLANCQVAVSLHRAGERPGESRPLSWRLYLPEGWTEDPGRRATAGIPTALAYQSKTDLALSVLDEALGWGAYPSVVLADEAYGASFQWRAALRQRGLRHAVRVPWTTTGWGAAPAFEAQKLTAKGWRQGPQPQRVEESLLVEWPADASEPTRYRLAQSGSDHLPLPVLVRAARARWRSERDYRELKEALGLDHFEGRSWPGWCHHVALVTAAFAFLRTEQRRRTRNTKKKPAAAHPAGDAPAPSDRPHPLERPMSLVPHPLWAPKINLTQYY